jgi:hypothetical protein
MNRADCTGGFVGLTSGDDLASPITLERTQALITPAATHIGFLVIR